MQNLIKKILLLTLFITALTSCSNEQIAASVIPKDATMVMTIDVKSLIEKGEFEKLNDLSSLKSFERELRSENRTMYKLFEDLKEDPTIAGLDLRDPIHIFTVPDGNNTYVGVAMSILDEDDFEAFLERILDDRSTPSYIKDEDNDDYLNYRVRNTMNISFDDDKVLFLSHSFKKNDDLFAMRDELMELEDDDTINENEVYQDFIDEQKDLNLYLSSNIIADNPNFRNIVPIVNYNLADNTLLGHLDFQDGKIVLDARMAYNDELKKMVAKNPIFDKQINTDLLKYLSEQNIIAGGFALNMKNYEKLLKEQISDSESQRILNEALGDFKLTDLFNKLEGSVVFTFNGAEEKEVLIEDPYLGESYTINKTIPKFSLIVGINDQQWFKNQLTKALDTTLQNRDGLHILQGDDAPYYMSYNKTSMLVTTDKKAAMGHKAGKSLTKSLKESDFSDNLDDIHMFISMKLNTKSIPDNMKRGTIGNIPSVEKSWNTMMDRFEIKVDNDSKASFTLYLKDDSKNSLSQLVSFVETTYKEATNR